jgi:3-deoxy-manno-octulosonate cytidylyltransferase (CMP-KDO synthetase)
VAVIPARWGSTRFPGKSLAPLCGKPLVQWVYERTRRAGSIGAVLIATDDARIVDAARAFGAPVALTRPDHPSGTDRVAEAVADLGAEVVVNVQGDEPLVDPALIDRIAADLLAEAAWDMATAASPIASAEDLASPAVVKVVWGADHRALYFSRFAIPFVRDADGPRPAHWRHIGIYGYRRAFLGRLVAEPPCALEQAEKLEQLRALHLGGRIRVIETSEAGIGVDTPHDVPRAEAALRRAGLAD